MSQIPRSQFALKKRHNPSPMVTIPVLDIEHQNIAKNKKSQNGSNGHKNGSLDSNDVVIIDDECFGVVNHEEVVAATEEVVVESPSKKKRSRKSKDSTESKDSSQKSVVEETQGDEATIPEKETKILKMTFDELRARRSDRLQNASTIVNLSTMSTTDQSTIVSDETSSERRVSGRRSTRPIDEIKYTYRSPENANDSLNATTNATIGSECNNDSLLATPATDRKRRVLGESTENIDSPKRSRLDLSGLFSSFSSPVTMLRNKFRRTNIASTPVAGGEAPLNESVESLDTTIGEEFKEIELNQEEIEAAPEEELKVITMPLKKSTCTIM